jgi:hypothetical protein
MRVSTVRSHIEGGARPQNRASPTVWLPAKTLPPLQHDLPARLAGFQQCMGTFQVAGIDGAKGLIERRAQHALVDEIGDVPIISGVWNELRMNIDSQ